MGIINVWSQNVYAFSSVIINFHKVKIIYCRCTNVKSLSVYWFSIYERALHCTSGDTSIKMHRGQRAICIVGENLIYLN